MTAWALLSITETTGEVEVERIREPLEEEEAVLMGSSDESPDGSKEQVNGRTCPAPDSPSVVRLGEEPLNSSRSTRGSLE